MRMRRVGTGGVRSSALGALGWRRRGSGRAARELGQGVKGASALRLYRNAQANATTVHNNIYFLKTQAKRHFKTTVLWIDFDDSKSR